MFAPQPVPAGALHRRRRRGVAGVPAEPASLPGGQAGLAGLAGLTGVLVTWGAGVLVCWCAGMLVCWVLLPGCRQAAPGAAHDYCSKEQLSILGLLQSS